MKDVSTANSTTKQYIVKSYAIGALYSALAGIAFATAFDVIWNRYFFDAPPTIVNICTIASPIVYIIMCALYSLHVHALSLTCDRNAKARVPVIMTFVYFLAAAAGIVLYAVLMKVLIYRDGEGPLILFDSAHAYERSEKYISLIFFVLSIAIYFFGMRYIENHKPAVRDMRTAKA